MGKSLDQLLAEERVVRRLVSGGVGLRPDRELLEVLGQGERNRAWRVGYLELSREGVPSGFPFQEVISMVSPSVLWRSEWQAPRGTLELTLVMRDRSSDRVNRHASQEVFGLFDRLVAQGFSVTGGLGSAVANIGGLPRSFQEARLASGYGIVHGGGIYTFHPAKELCGLASRDLEPFPESFYSALIFGTPIQPLILEFFRALTGSQASVRRIHQDVQKLFSRIADLLPATPAMESYYHILDLVRDPEDLRRTLEELCGLASRAIVEKRSSLADRKVREFQDYIAEHYMDCCLSITDVGRALQISPSYLGKLLKRGLQTTFVEFVTDFRMARARELLSGSDLLTYQIAESLGYPYTHYFSATFKKHMGTTPSGYRALVRSRGVLEAVAGVS